MKPSRFTDSQILAIIKQNEEGVSAADLCREHGMSQGLFYNTVGITSVCTASIES